MFNLGLNNYKQQKSKINTIVDSNVTNDEVLNLLFKKLEQNIYSMIENGTIKSDENAIEKYLELNGTSIIEREISINYPKVVFNDLEKRDIIKTFKMKLFGLGVIEPFFKDEAITEIMINNYETIFIEKGGIIQRAKNNDGDNIRFKSEDELRRVIEKIVSPINKTVNDSNPIVDARLLNGSRVNIVLNSIALNGSAITIRKFPENPYSLQDLITFDSLDEKTAKLLIALIRSKHSLIVSGGTGSGKTTILNALSSYIPSNERIITVEDSAELKFNQVENIIRMETKQANIEGTGEVTIRDLVKTSLRMRPDRIIVGEVRSGETLDMLQAMNTGHEGSLTTVHANSCEDVISRLETMVLMSGVDIPMAAVTKQIISAVDIIVQIKKDRFGKRRLDEIVMIDKSDKSMIKLKKIISYSEKKIDNSNFIIHIDELDQLKKLNEFGYKSFQEVLTKCNC